MYSRFLFVGLGGSGGKTLRFLKREILQWLEENDAGTSIPAGWQFLHIDTPTTADGDEIDHLADPLPADEYLGLIGHGLSFAAVQNLLDGDDSLRPELQTWRVEPGGMPIPIQMGAGQFRAVGQTISLAYTRQIANKLGQAVSRINSPAGITGVGEIYSKVTGASADESSPMYIVVVSSLAGGTGAGLLNTVCDVLRSQGVQEKHDAGDNIFGILYTPEVFDSLTSQSSAGGIQPNSLAAISEILNGHWWGGDPIATGNNLIPPITNPALTAAGLPKPIPRSGPSFPFLVGRVGAGGVDHGTPERLFEMVGRSLLSWVTDKQVQAKFIAYQIANWTNAAMNHTMGPILVNAGETQEKGLPCFSALGFARVSVGTDYFKKYTVQRIVKYANEVLVDYHYKSDEAKEHATANSTNDPDELADHIARNRLRHFMIQSHLAELGPEDNQIVDRLRPKNSPELYDDLKKRCRDLSGLGLNDDSKVSVREWNQRLHAGIGEATKGYEKDYQTALETSTLNWIETIQDDVIGTVEAEIPRVGLKVAAALCALAASELRHESHEDLMARDYNDNSRWARDWPTAVAEALEDIPGKIDSDHAGLNEALTIGMHWASHAGEALLASRAAELCVQVADRLLAPLEQALLAAHSQASEEQPMTARWVSWTDEVPPASVTPPSGDFPLIEPTDYPELFLNLLQAETKETEHPDVAKQIVLDDVVSGGFLRKDEGTQGKKVLCIQIDKPWWPDSAAALSGYHAPTNLRVRVETGLPVLEARTLEWLTRTGTPFGNFLSLSLRSYLGTTAAFDNSGLKTADVQKNRNRFLSKMTSAMNAAAPLINLDATLMGLVHPGSSNGPLMHFSQIPFQSHPTESNVIANMVAAGVEEATIPDLLTTDDSIRHIDITSSLHAPHSLLVIQSLLQPISAAWHEKVTQNDEAVFWSRRRAQRLQRFVPASQALILCMIRGWFTGTLLGRIDRSSDPIQVARPGKAIAAFPHPLLSTSEESGDSLARVLESLGLAYAEVSLLSQLEPLAAYIELRELGRSTPNSSLYQYKKLSQPLADWVRSGSFAERISDPFPQLHRASVDSPTGSEGESHRIDELINVLEVEGKKYEDSYQNHTKEWAQAPSSLSGPPLWTGLAPLISQALAGLASAARKHRSGLGEGGPLLG